MTERTLGEEMLAFEMKSGRKLPKLTAARPPSQSEALTYIKAHGKPFTANDVARQFRCKAEQIAPKLSRLKTMGVIRVVQREKRAMTYNYCGDLT